MSHISPQRVQRKRTKGSKLPANTVCVTRGTRWGNPYRVGKDCASPEQAVALYRLWLEGQLMTTPDLLEPLRGKNLACWCALSDPCHGDVLLELANEVIGDKTKRSRRLRAVFLRLDKGAA